MTDDLFIDNQPAFLVALRAARSAFAEAKQKAERVQVEASRNLAAAGAAQGEVDSLHDQRIRLLEDDAEPTARAVRDLRQKEVEAEAFAADLRQVGELLASKLEEAQRVAGEAGDTAAKIRRGALAAYAEQLRLQSMQAAARSLAAYVCVSAAAIAANGSPLRAAYDSPRQ